ncbi:DNA polymerase Y family protein [Rhodopseudomonas boonkerdii]|uniref:Y-family DNA polymerase n=1 Tax=Rhodopseudomonas boonkerdii TaxID=475937 RepID=UPI001E464252|nr:DNA polymerase Y family protein [Rhodopseudomonas boonkerdii]UGV24676.1 DNA polymerase Y family protein [Rhodopseudomonas boonkerdii]
MPRVVSIFLPTWPIDRMMRAMGAAAPDGTRPLVLVGQHGRRRIVTAANIVAAELGLRSGMPATKAQAMVPDLIVQHADPEADAKALDRLAVWALRYSPVVAADAPDGIVMDTAGADHLHGGEVAMAADVGRRLRQAGISAKVAISDAWGASHALARFSADESVVSPRGATREGVERLSIAALRLPADIVHDLRKLGFERIWALLETPRAPLALRFGPLVGRRLDQAVGQASEPIDPIRPAEMIEVGRTFVEPIGAAETIARYIGKLVVTLCAELEERGLGALRVDLVCHLVDNRIQVARVGTAVPIRDAKRLTRLLCGKIETIDPGFGIEVLRVAATLVQPFATVQTMSSLIDAAPADVTGLVDILANRLGVSSLYRMAPAQSDVPERSFVRVGATAPNSETVWPIEWPRPSRLLASPEPIETVALLPDHPPVNFTWRGVRRRVKRADGPERVFGEWWKRDAELVAVRDYFRVEDEAGERFWIFRAGDGEDAATGSHRWYLHGIFG